MGKNDLLLFVATGQSVNFLQSAEVAAAIVGGGMPLIGGPPEL